MATFHIQGAHLFLGQGSKGVAEKQSTSQKFNIPKDARLDWYIVNPQVPKFKNKSHTVLVDSNTSHGSIAQRRFQNFFFVSNTATRLGNNIELDQSFLSKCAELITQTLS